MKKIAFMTVAYLAAYAISLAFGYVVMTQAWGLQVKSWPWLLGGWGVVSMMTLLQGALKVVELWVTELGKEVNKLRELVEKD